MKALRTLGWQGDDSAELGEGRGGLDQREVMLTIEHEADRQGVLRSRVKWINSMGGLAMSNRVEGDKLKAFSAGLRGKILGLEPGRRPAPASPARPAPPSYRGPPEPPPHTDADIPF